MNHITVGVAGHIDHGKTALVRALTGIETDRLPEERERGMSIVLGFAYLTLPEGEVDLIDAPGHERFIRTMIAGATGTDAILLVVAATERIMPQTIEHVALCQLLGVKQGLVVAAKSDLVPDTEARDAVDREIKRFLGGTFLAKAPLIFASAVTGEGIDAIRHELGRMAAEQLPSEEKPGLLLPVDRVFTAPGHGTVVTGTLRRGSIRIGDQVEILPGGNKATVRSLEVHGAPAQKIGPGWRTAVNLRGVRKEDLGRGDILASPGHLHPTTLMDAELSLLPASLCAGPGQPRAVRHGDSVRIHYGTREAVARIHLLDRDEVASGETALIQLRFGEPQAAPAGERFVLRAISPAETIGGGRFIDIAPKRHTRRDSDILKQLATLAHGSACEKLAAKIYETGFAGRNIRELLAELDIDAETWDRESANLPVVICSEWAIHEEAYSALSARVMEQVCRYHAAHPTERGIGQEHLRRLLPKKLPAPVFAHLLGTLAEEGRIAVDGALVHEAGFSPDSALSPIEREIAQKMADQFARSALTPPNPAQVIGQDRRHRALYKYLVDNGTLIEAVDSGSGRRVAFHAGAVAQAEALLSKSMTRGQGYTVSDLNAILGTSRKYGIPLLEHLDSAGATRRVGDLRFIRNGPHPPADMRNGPHPPAPLPRGEGEIGIATGRK